MIIQRLHWRLLVKNKINFGNIWSEVIIENYNHSEDMISSSLISMVMIEYRVYVAVNLGPCNDATNAHYRSRILK